MQFLKGIVVALVLVLTSLTTTTLGFFHVAQSPTAKVSPVTTSTTGAGNFVRVASDFLVWLNP
jgi:hypothetical protein